MRQELEAGPESDNFWSQSSSDVMGTSMGVASMGVASMDIWATEPSSYNHEASEASLMFTDWILMPFESDFETSDTASSTVYSQDLFSPNQFFTAGTYSDVDNSPLQSMAHGFSPNPNNDPNSSPASSLISSAYPSPPSPSMYNASVQPSPATRHAQLSVPFTCTECGKRYKTKNNLQRHRRDALHGPTTPSPLFATYPHIHDSSGPSTPLIELVPEKKMYDCSQPQCPRKGDNGFPRKDNMVQHQRLVHNMQIPKRRERKGVQSSKIVKK